MWFMNKRQPTETTYRFGPEIEKALAKLITAVADRIGDGTVSEKSMKAAERMLSKIEKLAASKDSTK
jgi:hypothetical protein